MYYPCQQSSSDYKQQVVQVNHNKKIYIGIITTEQMLSTDVYCRRRLISSTIFLNRNILVHYIKYRLKYSWSKPDMSLGAFTIFKSWSNNASIIIQVWLYMAVITYSLYKCKESMLRNGIDLMCIDKFNNPQKCSLNNSFTPVWSSRVQIQKKKA